MKKKKTLSNILSNIVLVVAAGVFIFSGYKLYTIFSGYQEGSGEYKEIKKIATEKSTPPEMMDDLQEEDLPFEVDFQALQEINKDVVGWIRFDEPRKISYPVVKGDDNEKYLNTTFEGKKNKVGALFVDYCNAGDFSDRNTFVYGHNMKDGSMFGQLRKYKDKSFCEENPYFYIYTLDGREITYQVFAVSIVNDASESYKKSFDNDGEFLQYIEYIRSISRFTSDLEIGEESKIVSLSTCTNASEDERLLVHGVKIEEK